MNKQEIIENLSVVTVSDVTLDGEPVGEWHFVHTLNSKIHEAWDRWTSENDKHLEDEHQARHEFCHWVKRNYPGDWCFTEEQAKLIFPNLKDEIERAK